MYTLCPSKRFTDFLLGTFASFIFIPAHNKFLYPFHYLSFDSVEQLVLR